jgi:hypothetical protein
MAQNGMRQQQGRQSFSQHEPPKQHGAHPSKGNLQVTFGHVTHGHLPGIGSAQHGSTQLLQ